MKILITGGAGFIGSNLAEKLSRNNELVIIDDLTTGKMWNLKKIIKRKNVRFVKGNITNLALLRKISKDVNWIFHQAALTSVPRSIENPIKTNEINVRGTLNVLIAARDREVEKVVYASSSSIYGDIPQLPKREDMRPNPKSPYAVSKLAGEYYFEVFHEAYGLQTIALRYFNVFGPKQDPNSRYAAVIPRFIKRVVNNKPPIIYGDGTQTRDFTFVEDVVQATILAAKARKTGVLNIGSGKRITINELAKRMIEMFGKSLKPIYTEPRQGDIKHSLADISKAKREIGYNPRYEMKEGLRETIRWFCEFEESKR